MQIVAKSRAVFHELTYGLNARVSSMKSIAENAWTST